jgi:hypothetical protein
VQDFTSCLRENVLSCRDESAAYWQRASELNVLCLACQRRTVLWKDGRSQQSPQMRLVKDVSAQTAHRCRTVRSVYRGPGFRALDRDRRTSSPRATGAACRLPARSGRGPQRRVPAIAAGIYGFPPVQAARIAVDTIRSTLTTVECVRLMVIGQLACDILEAALDA